MAVEDNGPFDSASADVISSESQSVGTIEPTSDALERAPSADRVRTADIADAIGNATEDGKYPLVAFGLDKENRPNKALLVTSSIPDMVLAWDMLERFLGQDYEFSGYVPWNRLEQFADTHRMIVRRHVVDLVNFVAERDGDVFI